MTSGATRRGSARVQAALAVKCKLCQAPAGQDCRSIAGTGKPLSTGIIHMIRVPADVLGV